MRNDLVRLSLLGLAIVSACADDSSQPPQQTLGGDGSRIHRVDAGNLTASSTAPATEIVHDYLEDFVGGAVEQMKLVSQTEARNGVSHLRFEQSAGGLRIHGAYVKAAITDRGELVQVIEHLAPVGGLTHAAHISHKDALATAMREHGYDFATPAQSSVNGQKRGFARGSEFYRDPSVERVAYAEGGALKQGYLVETWSGRGNQLDYTLVGSNGQVVSTEGRTQNDSYNVFVEDPGKGPQTVVAGPGAGNAESPAGWLAGSQTTWNITGNNAHSYLDTDANNVPDTGGSAVGDGDFLTAAALGSSPSTIGNKAVAIQNLFFANNVVHDVLYRHGFTEAAGNFQATNFGLGGVGNDPVKAEAQDGSGTDNANFSTPNDGSSPRMQMFLWSSSTPNGWITVNGVNYSAYGSSFGPALSLAGVAGPLSIMAPADGCTSATAPLTSKVAIVNRGSCSFTVKVLNAQKAGAVAVIIVNDVPGNATAPSGTDRRIKISSGMVSQADGATLRGFAGTSGALRKNPAPPTMIDGDLDADIVFHEYGHGLTWRMIGGMNGKLAGAIGEGASDVNAFLINGDDVIGEYAYSDPKGIRRYPYATTPLTYSDWRGAEVHDDGEIYAGAMWKVLQNYQAAFLTADDLYGDFVDGMNFTAPTPDAEAMRDGMLQAAAGTGRECLIWRGFAASGIGVGADGRVSKNGAVTIIPSFTVPQGC